ncbi:MAG: hypothetical protein FWE21_03310 [Defluviitaleaceae bacterium]|nr:hypothetical protein [Defluviitaleaceae bacterium]
MEVIIKGEPKEIAALVLVVQERLEVEKGVADVVIEIDGKSISETLVD